MPKVALTAKWIESAMGKPRRGQVDYFDSHVPRLVLRLSPRASVWCYMSRADGRPLRLTIGQWPAMGLAEAREEVGRLRTLEAEGKDVRLVATDRRMQREVTRKAHGAREVSTVVSAWLKAHAGPTARRSRPLSRAALRDYERQAARIVQRFGERDIATLRRSELAGFLDELLADSPSEANKAWSALRRLYAHACRTLDLEANPAAAIERPARQAVRERVLTRGELRTLWRALDRVRYPYGPAMKLAILTGQRIGEIGAMRRADLDESGEWWIQRDNKARRRTDVYLAPMAQAIIAALPNFAGEPYLLSASGGANRLRSDTWRMAMQRYIEPAIAQVVAEGEAPMLDHWTRHDVRRTVATGLREWCGVSSEVAERVLNHSLSGVRIHYDFASYREPVRAALTAWAEEVQRIAGIAPAGGAVATQ